MADRMSNERIAELSEIQLYLDRDGDICRTGGGDNLVGCPAMSDDVMKGALNEAEWDAIPEAFDALRQTRADLAQANATIAARDAEIARLLERADEIDPVLEVEFDTQRCVEQNPYGATEAIEKALYLIRDMRAALAALADGGTHD